MTTIFALMVLLITLLVTTMTHLYDLTIYLYEKIYSEKIILKCPVILLKILQNICIKPTTRDVHLSIIKVFVTDNLFHFGAKCIFSFCEL